MATLLASIAALGIAAPGFAFAATAFVALYVLLGIGEPLASDITHRAAQSNERATVLSVQSLTLQLSGVIAALVLGRLAENVSFIAAFAVVASVLVLGALTCVGLRDPARSDEGPRRPVLQGLQPGPHDGADPSQLRGVDDGRHVVRRVVGRIRNTANLETAGMSAFSNDQWSLARFWSSCRAGTPALSAAANRASRTAVVPVPPVLTGTASAGTPTRSRETIASTASRWAADRVAT